MTYYDPASGTYGALGHGITDVDTALLMPLYAGSITEATGKAVKRGERGSPGELKGDFSGSRDLGTVASNTEGGIFGQNSDSIHNAKSGFQSATLFVVKAGFLSISTIKSPARSPLSASPRKIKKVQKRRKKQSALTRNQKQRRQSRQHRNVHEPF